MEYFARKMHVCVLSRGSGSYLISLLELVKNTEDEPVEFVLHRKVIPPPAGPDNTVAHIICFKAKTAEEAFRRFFSPGAGVRNDFPGITDAQWTGGAWWLDPALASDLSDQWVKVNRPGPASHSRSGGPRRDVRGGVTSTWGIKRREFS